MRPEMEKFSFYSNISICHLIFDIKMDVKFTRKASFFYIWHMADPYVSLTHYIIVSVYSVRISFTLAAINDIDIWECDIGNAYLNV